MTRNRAIYELILAGALWGFGFVATVWGLKTMTPVQFLFLRFFLAFFFSGIIAFAINARTVTSQKKWLAGLLAELRIGWPAGILLGILLLLQTVGLKTTSATESGFITTLYVIFVPLFQHFFFRKKQPLSVFVFATFALIGVYFLAGGLSTFDTGHLLTLACAMIAAIHIIYVGLMSSKSQKPFQFNSVQSLFCMLMMATMLPLEPTSLLSIKHEFLPWLGLLITVFGSTLIAFTIQIRTQKVLSATTASMLFLLESPYAALFGALFLNERLSWLQMSGACLILISSFLTVKAEKL
ncbi:MAG: DMT family transporter [Bdellovibrionaceae bacterium]|nr:DMT family transporter [Pseudobdellovibrionaceae bacterium]